MDLLTMVVTISLLGMAFMGLLYWRAMIELHRREMIIRTLLMQLSSIAEEMELMTKDQDVDELFR